MYLGANWKMNLFRNEAISLYSEIVKLGTTNNNCELIVFPSIIHLSELTAVDPKHLGSQNHAESEGFGAFTGEVSLQQIRDIGISTVLIGHSERRELFHENNEVIKTKLSHALNMGFHVVFCCGEGEIDRRNGTYLDFVSSQIKHAFSNISKEMMQNVVIAYEPIWSIGTGNTANNDQIEEMHSFIRKQINDMYSINTANQIRIIYGGSCNANNAASIFSIQDVDGGLIGGASLKLDSFAKIIEAACSHTLK